MEAFDEIQMLAEELEARGYSSRDMRRGTAVMVCNETVTQTLQHRARGAARETQAGPEATAEAYAEATSEEAAPRLCGRAYAGGLQAMQELSNGGKANQINGSSVALPRKSEPRPRLVPRGQFYFPYLDC
jgi:hypothetical protein